MHRLLVFVLVATLTITPGASAWCQAWCDSQHPPATAGECHHHDDMSNPTIGAETSCADVAWVPANFTNPESQRLPSPATHAVSLAMATQPAALNPSTSLAAASACSATTPAPHTTILRI